MLYAAPSYLDRRDLPTDLGDFVGHDAVIYARSGRVHPWVFPQADGSLRDVTPPARLRFDDLDSIVTAASAGFGLVWLPE
ncbi:LysR substrate-binding domain-containing protein [Asaia sp. As-1742]|uniref:LysR substrate-binding domain-containing protein n=1 Tax=Asaia sp. As-1742 TaxID=2608325 RepID=UPI00141ECD3F|nr:LysR substrate-binding domain-containing protein [Asaia sp. As-1742]NIE81577.1 hypothetical protein [Asaia sp. As-1742]